jgi:SEC-C motif-containing protein
VSDLSPATATELMRSRYEAYVALDAEYLLATWHPRTRPATLELDPGIRWRSLEILGSVRGGRLDMEGTVEFVARYLGGHLHETSRFLKLSRRWYYVNGDLH